MEEKEAPKTPVKEPGRRGRPPSAKNVTTAAAAPPPTTPATSVVSRRGRPPLTVKKEVKETKREGRTRNKSGSGQDLMEQINLNLSEETNESVQCKK